MAICPQCQSTDISLKSARKGECRNCKERFTIHDRQRERNDHSQSQKNGKRATYMVNEYEQDASFTPNKRSRYEDDNDIHPARNDTRMNRLAIQRGIPSSSSALRYGSSTDKPALFSLSSKQNRNNTNINNSQRVNQINDDEEDDLLERVKREELESIDFDDDATQDTEMLLEHFNTRFAKPVSKRNMYQTTSGSIDFDQDDDDTIDDDVLNLGINDNTMSSSDRTLRDTSFNTRKGSSTIVDEDEDLYTWHMPLKKRNTRGMKHQTQSQQQSQQRLGRQHDDSESESDFQPEGVDDDDDDDLFDTDEEELPQRRQLLSRFPHNHSPAFKRPLYNATTDLDNIEYAAAATTSSSRQRNKKAPAQPKPIAPGTVSVDVINKAKQGKKDKGKGRALRPDPMFSDEEDYIASDFEETPFYDTESREQSQSSSQAPEEPLQPPKTMHEHMYAHHVPRPGNKFNPFFLFNKAMRRNVLELDVSSNKEVSQKISQMWRELSKEEKQKYIDESKRLKNEYYASQGHRKCNLKMPPNSFVFFSREMYPKLKKENPELKFKDINTIVSRKWKELDEASKNVYKEQSQNARQKFIEENGEYYKSFMESITKKVQITKENKKKKYQEFLEWYNKR